MLQSTSDAICPSKMQENILFLKYHLIMLELLMVMTLQDFVEIFFHNSIFIIKNSLRTVY